MLKEIKCDKFSTAIKDQTVFFHDGLNTVIGGDDNLNSIGKSTFLLIVDFCFGGIDYAKRDDIISHIGHHEIQFCFVFDGKEHWFSRATDSPQKVFECSPAYRHTKELSLSDFNQFLKKNCFPFEVKSSFRCIMGRFARIHPKNNYNVDKPLEGHRGEKEAEGIKAFEELFGVFSSLSTLRETYEKAKEDRKVFISALKHGYVTRKIKTKKEFEEAKHRVEALKESISGALSNQSTLDFAVESLLSEEDIQTSILYRTLARKRNRLYREFAHLEEISPDNQLMTEEDRKKLNQYFPSIELKTLDEINQFQKALLANVNEEILAERERIRSSIKELDNSLAGIKSKLDEKRIPANASTTVLESILREQREMDDLEKQIQICEEEEKLKVLSENAKIELTEKEKEIVPGLQQKINDKLLALNDVLYEERRESPRLEIKSPTSYTYFTPSDNGTGTSYKSLILFDIALLYLSALPMVIHDSLLFKNIWDQPTEKIFQLLDSLTNKQVFVSIDRVGAFDENTQRIIRESGILELGQGKQSLFGFSWAAKREGDA